MFKGWFSLLEIRNYLVIGWLFFIIFLVLERRLYLWRLGDVLLLMPMMSTCTGITYVQVLSLGECLIWRKGIVVTFDPLQEGCPRSLVCPKKFLLRPPQTKTGN